MKQLFTTTTRAVLLLLLTLLVSFHVRADNLIWTGDGGAGDWTDANNFFDVEVGSEGAEAPAPSDNVEIPAVIPGLPAIFSAGSVNFNDLTVDLGATLSLNSIAIMILNGTFSNSGTLSLDQSAIDAFNFDAVNSGTITVANGANLSISNGVSFTNSGNIDIDGSSYVLLEGDLINTGSFTNSDGTTPTPGGSGLSGIEMQATSDVTISGGGYIDNIEVDNCDVCTTAIGTSVGDTLHIRNMLLPESSAFVTNNRLVLSPVATSSSSALSGMGMIGTIGAGGGSGSLTGGVTVSQYIPAGRRAYRFYSHPFTAPVALSQVENGIDITGVGGATNGFTPTLDNNPSAMWFNAATGNDDSVEGHLNPGWNFFANTTSTSGVNSFQQYEGINLFMRGAKGEGLSTETYTPSATTITIYGDAVNTGTQSIPLHTGPHGTFNMIGNPFPCVIDLGDALNSGSNPANLGSTSFFVWDPYSGAQGAYSTIIAGTPYYLQPNTAFQVESAPADGGTLTFQETDKSTGLGSNPELFRQQNPAEKNQMVQLKVYDAAYHPYDMFYLQLTNTATNGKEKADAAKPSNPDFNLFSVASTGEHLAVDARPYVAGDVIPMGVNATKPQTFIIRAEDYYAPAGTVLYLHDKYMGVYTQLLQGEEYKFDITTDPNSQGGNRFELRMGDVTSTETVKAATGLSINVTPNPATAEINVAYNAQATGNTTIRITNMMGQQVYTTALGAQQSGNVTVPVTAIPAGMYIVTLSCGDKTTTQRFVKQ